MIFLSNLYLSWIFFLYSTNPPATYDCKLIINNLANKKGTLYIGCYNQAQGFRDEKSVFYGQKIPVSAQSSSDILLKKLPKGSYAISVFLDENDDKKLNFNLLGIPKELYGFSNNPTILMRAPTFEECAFLIDKPLTINIYLK